MSVTVIDQEFGIEAMIACQHEVLSWLLDANAELDPAKDELPGLKHLVEHQRTESTGCHHNLVCLRQD
jgi:hypothetical protein